MTRITGARNALKEKEWYGDEWMDDEWSYDWIGSLDDWSGD